MPHASTFVKFITTVSVLCIMLSAGAPDALADEPDLPAGLFPAETANEPEPALPSGLVFPGTEATDAMDPAAEAGLPVEVEGFGETRLGFRIDDDPDQSDTILREIRVQFALEKDMESSIFRVTGDLLYDGVLSEHGLELEGGTGFLDLREFNVLVRPAPWLDIKAGRQILTWGTGDLIFINDLFPKDWNSFFIGRDLEYLKAPSDSVKASLFASVVNLDLVYTPRFDPDRYIDGRRISFFDSSQGIIVGRSSPLSVDKPDEWFSDDEFALRLYRNFGSWEAALYGYDGFWKSPNGVHQPSGLFIFPSLTVLGGSIRGPAAGGIANAEFGYYNSRDDRDGDDPLIRNGEWRILVGFEKEVASELTAGVQYYLERMSNYNAYLLVLPSGSPVKDENRHVITLRLTRLLMSQNLKLSLFNFYSPSDEDGYLRLNSTYKVTDAWQVEAGGNFLYGENNNTFFGQFQDASNLYVGVRYSF